MRKSPSYALQLPIGYQCGELTVDSEKYVKNGRSFVSCKCSCGNRTEVRTDCFKKELVKSCGCKKNYYTSINHNKRCGTLAKDGRKVCSRCFVDKDVSEFTKLKTKKDGLRPVCTHCRHKQEDIIFPIGFEFKGWKVVDNPIVTEHVNKRNYKRIKKHYKCYCMKCNKHKIFTEMAIKTPATFSCDCYKETHNKPIYLLREDGFKFCDICEQFKEAEQFPNNKKTPDKLNAYCKDCRWNHVLNRQYKITKEEYDLLVLKYDNRCHICKRLATTRNERTNKYNNMCVDHCHKTGIVRGILCTRCNTGIGQLGDNSEGMMKAYLYLKEFEDGLDKTQTVSDNAIVEQIDQVKD